MLGICYTCSNNGFSRCCIYLQCNDNNKSETRPCYICSKMQPKKQMNLKKIRTDYWTENVLGLYGALWQMCVLLERSYCAIGLIYMLISTNQAFSYCNIYKIKYHQILNLLLNYFTAFMFIRLISSFLIIFMLIISCSIKSKKSLQLSKIM